MFPFGLPLTVDASFAGPVIITIEGLDWDTHAVIARAPRHADVVAQHDDAGVADARRSLRRVTADRRRLRI